MAYRPSLLLDLTPAEILQYWSLLDSDQRAEWLAQRGEQLGLIEGGEALVASRPIDEPPETMFDRFAGMFHGFAVLERTVRHVLDQNDERQAEFLICGQKPSLTVCAVLSTASPSAATATIRWTASCSCSVQTSSCASSNATGRTSGPSTQPRAASILPSPREPESSDS